MLDEKLFYAKDGIYAVTIAPDDRLQWFNDKKRYNHFYDHYYKLLMELFDVKHYDYYFRIELSEPRGEVQSSGPRLHLHGFVIFKSKSSVFQWLLHAMCKLLEHARMEVSYCNDTLAWFEYIHKQEMYQPDINTLSNIGRNDFMSLLAQRASAEVPSSGASRAVREGPSPTEERSVGGEGPALEKNQKKEDPPQPPLTGAASSSDKKTSRKKK